MTVCNLSSNKVGRLQSILLVIVVDYYSFEPCQGKYYRCYNHVTGEIILEQVIHALKLCFDYHMTTIEARLFVYWVRPIGVGIFLDKESCSSRKIIF